MTNDNAKFTFKKHLLAALLPTSLIVTGCASTGLETAAVNENTPQQTATTVEAPMATLSFPSAEPSAEKNTEKGSKAIASTPLPDEDVIVALKAVPAQSSEDKLDSSIANEIIIPVVASNEETEEVSTNDDEPLSETTPAATDFANTTGSSNKDEQKPIEVVEVDLTVTADEVEAIAYPQHRVVKFKFNSAEISAADMDNLTEHASYLRKNPKAILIVNGHADSQGPQLYNQALSEKRAQQVAELLILMGINAEQIKTQAFGAEQPMDTVTAYKENRRVELSYEEPTLLSSRDK